MRLDPDLAPDFGDHRVGGQTVVDCDRLERALARRILRELNESHLSQPVQQDVPQSRIQRRARYDKRFAAVENAGDQAMKLGGPVIAVRLVARRARVLETPTELVGQRTAERRAGSASAGEDHNHRTE